MYWRSLPRGNEGGDLLGIVVEPAIQLEERTKPVARWRVATPIPRWLRSAIEPIFAGLPGASTSPLLPLGPFDHHKIKTRQAPGQRRRIVFAGGRIDQVQPAGHRLAGQQPMHAGFAGVADGNALTEDQQWAKLELIVKTAGRVWGRG